jgi:hypothetical protein
VAGARSRAYTSRHPHQPTKCFPLAGANGDRSRGRDPAHPRRRKGEAGVLDGGWCSAALNMAASSSKHQRRQQHGSSSRAERSTQDITHPTNQPTPAGPNPPAADGPHAQHPPACARPAERGALHHQRPRLSRQVGGYGSRGPGDHCTTRAANGSSSKQHKQQQLQHLTSTKRPHPPDFPQLIPGGPPSSPSWSRASPPMTSASSTASRPPPTASSGDTAGSTAPTSWWPSWRRRRTCLRCRRWRRCSACRRWWVWLGVLCWAVRLGVLWSGCSGVVTSIQPPPLHPPYPAARRCRSWSPLGSPSPSRPRSRRCGCCAASSTPSTRRGSRR